MLQDQGRVDPGPAGNAPHRCRLEPSVAELLSRRVEDPGLCCCATGRPAGHRLGDRGAFVHGFTLCLLSETFVWCTVDSTLVERLATRKGL